MTRYIQGFSQLQNSIHIVVIFIMVCLLNACAKKELPAPKDIKTQIKTQQPSIPFATTQAQSKQWYKEYLTPIIPKSLDKKEAQNYEKFAKMYFADLSQIEPKNPQIPKDKLLQSVIFTHFAQKILQEFSFIQNQNLAVVPWEIFKSNIALDNSVLSASFVANISSEIGQLENESYENLNEIVLAYNLLFLTKRYYKGDNTSEITQKITGLAHYVLPDSIHSMLMYRILYARYVEKFHSGYLLSSMSKQFPDSTLKASNKILYTKEKHNDIKTMQKYFSFTPFEPTNPTSISQCRAGSSHYPEKNVCIQSTFIPWLSYLQTTLKRHHTDYVLPIFTDSKLCLLIARNRIIVYPDNNENFCKNLIASWQNYQNNIKNTNKHYNQ